MSFVSNILLLCAVALPLTLAWRAVRRSLVPAPAPVPVDLSRPPLPLEDSRR
jgi:hypothetical protein